MLDRISVTVSLTTIFGVLAKLALLLHPASGVGLFGDNANIWHDRTILVVAIFLIFFRGKMMHDDHQYFTDIEKGRYHPAKNSDPKFSFFAANKFGLFLGYVSWLFWAPAVYSLDNLAWFGFFLWLSIAVSTIWAGIDSLQIPASSPRYPKRTQCGVEKEDPWLKQHSWVVINFGYLITLMPFLVCVDQNQKSKFWSAIGLMVLLMIDWLISKPIATTIEAADSRSGQEISKACRFTMSDQDI